MESIQSTQARRSDAERNRLRIVQAAREAMDEANVDPSMAEIARRAGVGMATLYRNFSSRLDLVEELYREQVSEICAAAKIIERSANGGEALFLWLEQFHLAGARKGALASLLLTDAHRGPPVMNESRARVVAAAEPLYAVARRAGAIRGDLSLPQILDAIVAIGRVTDDPVRPGRLIRLILDGLRCPEKPI